MLVESWTTFVTIASEINSLTFSQFYHIHKTQAHQLSLLAIIGLLRKFFARSKANAGAIVAHW